MVLYWTETSYVGTPGEQMFTYLAVFLGLYAHPHYVLHVMQTNLQNAKD